MPESILACIDIEDGTRYWKGVRYRHSSSCYPSRTFCWCCLRRASWRRWGAGSQWRGDGHGLAVPRGPL